jgi:hypothetical protein
MLEYKSHNRERDLDCNSLETYNMLYHIRHNVKLVYKAFGRIFRIPLAGECL